MVLKTKRHHGGPAIFQILLISGVRQKLSGFGKTRLTGLYWSLCSLEIWGPLNGTAYFEFSSTTPQSMHISSFPLCLADRFPDGS